MLGSASRRKPALYVSAEGSEQMMLATMRDVATWASRAVGGGAGARLACAAVVGGAAAAGVVGQSTEPALFVSNNGNLEGSVTSFTVNSNGTPTFADIERTSDTDDDPGTNANAIALSPNGRFLAIGHAAGGTSPVRQLTILEVASDASLAIVGEFDTPATPLDLVWVNDELLAVTQTDLSITNRVLTYLFVPGESAMLVPVGDINTGPFTTDLAKHPTAPVLYAGDTSGGQSIFVIDVAPNGQLTLLGETPTPVLPIDPAVSNGAEFVYAFSGITGGGETVLGYRVQPDFTLEVLPTSPYVSPGASPKSGVFSDDDSLLFVSHGTDATVRSFRVDSDTGELTSTGSSFDVGLQGSVGEMTVLNDVLYVMDDSNAIDGVSGVVTLKYDGQGVLTQIGSRAPTQGVTPTGIVSWPGVSEAFCPGDATGDGVIDGADLVELLGAFGSKTNAGEDGGDFDGSRTVDGTDLIILLGVFGESC
jgi:hypothetical protein